MKIRKKYPFNLGGVPGFVDDFGVVYSADRTVLKYTSYSFCEKYYTVPFGVRKIESGAFDGSGAVRIRIPSSVEEIGYQAFPMTLSIVILPESLKEVSPRVFDFNLSLQKVYVPEMCFERYATMFQNVAHLFVSYNLQTDGKILDNLMRESLLGRIVTMFKRRFELHR